MIMPPLFSIEELDALDEKQLEILKYLVINEIVQEIGTNAELRNLLREKLLPRYNEFRRQAPPQRARASGSPRTSRSR